MKRNRNQKTVYVPDELLEVWESIANKSEFIRQALMEEKISDS